MLKLLFALLLVIGSPLTADVEADIEKIEEQVEGFDVKKIIKLGGLLSTIGGGTSRLGTLLEKGDVDEIKRTIRSLDGDISLFSDDLKELVHEDYYPQIDQARDLAIGNLENIREHVTEENIGLAKDEYWKMMGNWENLTDYYSKRAQGLLKDKEATKGWLNWLTDLAYSWWYSDDE